MSKMIRKTDPERGERIKHVRVNLLRIRSQEKFAERLSEIGKPVTRGAVGNWELGKEIGLDSLTAICRLSGVDLNWLAFDDGDPPEEVQPKIRLVSSFDPDEPEADAVDGAFTQDTWKPRVPNAIPEVDGKLGAGPGQVGEVINIPVGKNSVSGHKVVAEWLLPDEYLRNEAKVSPQNTLVMEIVGDSMQPTYQPGDRVLVDLSQNYWQSDTVYAISDGFSEPQIKRLQRVPFSNPPQVVIVSDNPALQPFTVELERLTIIGRICAVVSRR